MNFNVDCVDNSINIFPTLPKWAHTRMSLAHESNSAWVPMSQTCPCVGHHAHTCGEINLSQLLTEPNLYVYGPPNTTNPMN